jgi:type IX secretion system PorP/SprF family membrane protein
MKRIILSIFSVCALFSAKAQQIPLTSQYMFNPLVINPAVAGMREDRMIFRLQNRNQWVGLDGAPVTQVASGHGKIEPWSVGLGGYVINDVVGPTRQLKIQTAYSYHFPVTAASNLSFGLGLGLMQYKIDGSKITTDMPDDIAIAKGIDAHLLPDASFGVLYYGTSYYIGASVPHLLGSRIKDTQFRLSRHYQILGGTLFELSDDFIVEPSMLVQLVSPVPLSADLNARIIYKETFWLGGSYRTSDAVILMAGIRVADKFHFGYSFDITTSSLSQYSKGSHEVMLGFDLVKKASRNQRRTISPSLL